MPVLAQLPPRLNSVSDSFRKTQPPAFFRKTQAIASREDDDIVVVQIMNQYYNPSGLM